MAMEKKDRELFKRFIDLILDIDDVNESNIKQKLAEAEQLEKDCEARKAELEIKKKAAERECQPKEIINSQPRPINNKTGRFPKLFTTPVKAEGLRHGPTEETYCSEQMIAEFIMSRAHEKDFLFHLDIGTNTYLTFRWEEGYELHLYYTDEEEHKSGGCTMINPDADDIAEMVLNMIGEEDERETD